MSLLGTMMLRAGLLSADQLAAVQAHVHEHKNSFVESVLSLGYADQNSIVSFLHSKLMIPRVGASVLKVVDEASLSRIPAELAYKYSVLPVSTDEAGNLTLAMADPTDMKTVDAISEHTGAYLVRAVAPLYGLREAISEYYGPMPGQGADTPTSTTGAGAVSAPAVAAPAVTAPVLAAPSAPSISAPAVRAPSVAAPSISAPSISAPAVAPPSVAAPSISAPVAPAISAPAIARPVAPNISAPLAAPPIGAPPLAAPSISAPVAPSISAPPVAAPSISAPSVQPPLAAPSLKPVPGVRAPARNPIAAPVAAPPAQRPSTQDYPQAQSRPVQQPYQQQPYQQQPYQQQQYQQPQQQPYQPQPYPQQQQPQYQQQQPQQQQPQQQQPQQQQPQQPYQQPQYQQPYQPQQPQPYQQQYRQPYQPQQQTPQAYQQQQQQQQQQQPQQQQPRQSYQHFQQSQQQYQQAQQQFQQQYQQPRPQQPQQQAQQQQPQQQQPQQQQPQQPQQQQPQQQQPQQQQPQQQQSYVAPRESSSAGLSPLGPPPEPGYQPQAEASRSVTEHDKPDDFETLDTPRERSKTVESQPNNKVTPYPARKRSAGWNPPQQQLNNQITPLSPEAFSRILPRFATVTSRDQITSLLLDFLAEGFERVIMFVHIKGEIRGRDARGEDLMVDAVRQIRIPAGGPSLFSTVIEHQTPYFGQMRTDTAIDNAFFSALGGVHGNVLVVPVILRKRVPLLVFASGARHAVDANSLHDLTETVGQAFERLIVADKARK